MTMATQARLPKEGDRPLEICLACGPMCDLLLTSECGGYACWTGRRTVQNPQRSPKREAYPLH